MSCDQIKARLAAKTQTEEGSPTALERKGLTSMRTPIETGMAMFIAVAVLKLKRARFVTTREGVEIHSPGKPVLLLTYENANRFSQEIAETENS